MTGENRAEQVGGDPAVQAHDDAVLASVLPARWEFMRLVRQPSRWGVAALAVRHAEKGSVVVRLSREELRQIAMQALEAMEPIE